MTEESLQQQNLPATKEFRGYWYGHGDGWIAPECGGGANSMPHKCPHEFDGGGASGGTEYCNCRCHYT
jgi:hypothetical protein